MSRQHPDVLAPLNNWFLFMYLHCLLAIFTPSCYYIFNDFISVIYWTEWCNSLQLKYTDCQRLPGSTKTIMRSMTTRRRKGNFGKPLTTQADNHAKKNPTREWKEKTKSRGIALQSRDHTRSTLHTRPTEASRDHCCLAHQQMPRLIRKQIAFLLSLTSITTFFLHKDHTN